NFATSITFAKAVTASGSLSNDGVTAIAGGTAPVVFSETITVSGTASSLADIYIASFDGPLNVVGNITGIDSVTAVSNSGAITLSGAVTTSGTNNNSGSGGVGGDIYIGSSAGVVLLSDNISTTGTGDMTLMSGKSLTANSTLTTSGTSAGKIGIYANSNSTVSINKAISAGTGAKIILLASGMGAISVAKDATITAGAAVELDSAATGVINIASGADITAGTTVDDLSSAGTLNLGANITTTAGSILIDNMAINLTGAVALKVQGTGSDITLASVNGAQNLTLEAPATVTVTNSAGVTASDFSAANVVLSNTTGTIAFGGPTNISSSLTTTANAYNISFNGTTVLAGAPVFLNTGNITFAGITSLTSGATITGGPATNVNLAGTIVSGGAFNIGANILKANISNGTTLNLASSTNESTFASRVILPSGFSFGLNGVGTLTLSGDSSDPMHVNGFVGIANVTNGTLNVTGSLCQASGIFLRNGTLTGNGQV
ncbi:MAG: hypothetical protein EBT92_19655, partial [Planctomycetes bacterium]|nr:hypothetical protein [Planctomycetota bacterium]